MLYLNSPVGYPIAAKIEKNDTGGLKSFLINLTNDEEMQDLVRQSSHEQVIKMLEDSGFTFDEEWYGARENPEQVSRLDDPNYRRSIGIYS